MAKRPRRGIDRASVAAQAFLFHAGGMLSRNCLVMLASVQRLSGLYFRIRRMALKSMVKGEYSPFTTNFK